MSFWTPSREGTVIHFAAPKDVIGIAIQIQFEDINDVPTSRWWWRGFNWKKSLSHTSMHYSVFGIAIQAKFGDINDVLVDDDSVDLIEIKDYLILLFNILYNQIIGIAIQNSNPIWRY